MTSGKVALALLALVALACGGRSILELDGRQPKDAGADAQNAARGGGTNDPRDAEPPDPRDAEPEPHDAEPDAPDPSDADAPILAAPVLSAAGSTDYGFTCALSVYGRATCWGGTHFVPEFTGEYRQPPPDRYVDIWNTPTHGCAIEADSRAIRCFGYEPAIVPPEGAFRRFARSGQFGGRFCALRDDHKAVCFGGSEEFVRDGPFRAYARGNLECGINASQELRCWDGFTSERVSLTFIDRPWTDIAVGEREFCALGSAGEARCAPSPGSSAVPKHFTDILQLSLGFTGSCTVTLGNEIECWTTSAVSADVPPEGSFDAVAVGFYFGCAARTDGTVACWGRNDYGQGSPPSGLMLR
jgi:hypothetical protein